MTQTYQITAHGTDMGDHVGATRDDAIASYCRTAGYASIADAASALGQTPEEFCADLVVGVPAPSSTRARAGSR